MLSSRLISPPRATGSDAALSRLVLVHGFTQNAGCWGPFADTLGATHEVIALDAPGHGASDHDDVNLVAAGQLLLEAGGTGHWIGYSMGGRMLLHAALDDAGAAMASLVVIGATGGIDDATERAERHQRDAALADHIEAVGSETFIDEWLATPLFASLAPAVACREQRCENRPAGMAASLRHCGTATQAPLWNRLEKIEIPVLVIAGSTDAKFRALGERLVTAIGPNARLDIVEGGHAVHLENPHGTAEAVIQWMTRHHSPHETSELLPE